MIHYFNPDHETAILNASKHYQPPEHVFKIQTDLAFLPAWYASEGDFVFMENQLPYDFIESLESLNLCVKSVNQGDFSDNRKMFQDSTIEPWGISPQCIHFFEKLNLQWNLSLVIPPWKEEYHFLGSRFASRQLLAGLLDRISGIEKEILPHFVSDIETIEQITVQSQEPLLIKSPYSSSGRGLLRLAPGKLAKSEKQIISGMLKKQKQVSIEKLLDKHLDFSMQFECTANGGTNFIGYSIFKTNDKGAYQKSLLDNQGNLEKQITKYISKDLLFQTRKVIAEKIQEMYAPFYSGIIGIDMLIYKAGDLFRLHPCVEINMRKTMGYLAVRLTEKHLHPDSQGELIIDYNPDPQTVIHKHKNLQLHYPLIVEKGLIRSGYLSLCPVAELMKYMAYVIRSP